MGGIDGWDELKGKSFVKFNEGDGLVIESMRGVVVMDWGLCWR